MRRLFPFMAAFLLVAGCTGAGIPNFTIPPELIPSGGQLNPGGSVDPNSGACALVTAQEVSAAMGTNVTVSDSGGSSCTFSLGLAAVTVTTDTSADLQTARLLFGESAKDLTVGGFPAVSGVFIGQPAVYVQKGSNQLQVMGILTGSDDATIAKLVQIATIAVGRMP